MLNSDPALNVDDIVFYSRITYPDADIVEIRNAMHDIALSSDEIIDECFSQISKWLNTYF